MNVHLLVEGASERAFLEPWCRRLLNGKRVKVHPHQGKGSLRYPLSQRPDPRHRGLLDQLPAKLRGFAAAEPPPRGVVVLIDADDESCKDLASAVLGAAAEVAPSLNVVVRVAIEETEAFYLGDLRAVEKAYPDADMGLARRYVPDSIVGTWETFGQVIGDDGENKVAWAETMGEVVTTSAAATRSPSHRALMRALRRLLKDPPAPAQKRRKYRHATKPTKDPSRRR